MRTLVLLLSAALFCVASASPDTAPLPATPATRPNIILITLDTTRADRMGFLGSKRGVTPNLDALASQSVVFTRAYSHVPLTTASHATILTGTYPQFNGVNDFGKPLLPKVPFLPDLLHARGYQTAAFVGSLVLDPVGGTAPGFDRGFDTYDAGFRSRRKGEDRYSTLERRAGEVVARATRWLTKRNAAPTSKKPFFLWVHVYDAHDPYDPPQPYATRYAKEPYDGELAYVDASIGKLLNQLRTSGQFENSLIIAMADHGEAFGEHGERSHGIFLYDETIHVPLILKLPDEQSPSRKITTRVGLVDVTPTLLQSAGTEIPEEVQGESLLKIIKPAQSASSTNSAANAAPPAPDRPAYAETDYPRRAFGWSSLRALRSGKYLYIRSPDPELYDQSADPSATRNVAASSPAVRETLAAQLDDFRRKTTTAAVLDATGTLTPEQAQKLSALGYLASDANNSPTTANDTADLTKPDPKTKIDLANLLHDALLDVEESRYAQALPMLKEIVAREPQMAAAQMQLGAAYAGLKDYKQALPPLQRAVELLPDSSMAHYQLGLALYETGDWQAAAPQFESVVERTPKWADAHFSLAAVDARIDKVPEAMDHLKITLDMVPDHYRANLLRGRILYLQGDAASAIPNLQAATKSEPTSVEAHTFLAEAYAQTGNVQAAATEQATAAKLKSSAPSAHP
jgi:arylsulfatase A-like enzyme/thioredoxin-like negative regulator of GroEL